MIDKKSIILRYLALIFPNFFYYDDEDNFTLGLLQDYFIIIIKFDT